MKLNQVGYYTEDPAMEYRKGVDNCKTLEELKVYLDSWQGLADDAIKTVKPWGHREFKKFKKHLVKERAGEYCGSDWIADILLPVVMFKASALADQYCCPWGTAIIRITQVK